MGRLPLVLALVVALFFVAVAATLGMGGEHLSLAASTPTPAPSWDANVTPVNELAYSTIWGLADSEMYLPKSAGDLNGDGVDDIVLISERVNGPDGNRREGGAAFVYFGGNKLHPSMSITNGADMAVYGANPVDRFGRLADVADVNNDGIDDLIVSSQDYNDGSRGRVDIIFGRRNLPASIDLSTHPADVTILGAHASDDLGSAIATGDVDGDGLTDLIVTARNVAGPDGTRYGAGAAYIFLGKSGLPPVIDLSTYVPDVTIYGPDEEGYFSYDAATGDLNGDHIDDIVFGSFSGHGIDNTLDNAGEVQTDTRPSSVAPRYRPCNHVIRRGYIC